MSFTHDDILMPLAIAVIIDKKVRTPELRSFTRQAQGLIELFELSPRTDDDLRAWFATHVEDLEDKLAGPRKNTKVLGALSKFKHDRDVEAVYDAMVSISVSDQEYATPESELIKSACAIWGFARPPLKVDRP